MVCPLLLSLPPGELHSVSPAGQQQLIGFEQRGGVDGVTVDETHQVLAVVFPEAGDHQRSL